MKQERLGDLTERVSTWQPSNRPNEFFDYIDLSSVDNEEKRIRTATSLLGSEAPSRARQIVCGGDVLVSTVRPNLNAVAVVDPHLDGATASTGFTVLRPICHLLDSQYLFHWVRTPAFIGSMVRQGTGASYPAVSDRIIKKSLIPTPAMPEQRRIAAILDQAEALRAKRRRVLAHLDALTSSIFDDMFSATEARVSLGEVIAHGPTNGLYRPVSDYGWGTPILRIDGFDKGVIYSNEWKRVQIDEADMARYSLSPGDIVINRVNALSHLGKSALVRSLTEPSVFESNMMRLSLDEDRVLPEFVIAWLQTSSAKQQILSKAKKAINQASINQPDLRSLMLPLPPRAEQEAFDTTLRQVFQRMTVANRSLAALDTLFESLQSRAFRGEL